MLRGETSFRPVLRLLGLIFPRSNRNVVGCLIVDRIVNLLFRAARLSIQVTVVRLLQPGLARTASKCAAMVFVIMWMAVFTQEFFVCGSPMPALPLCRYRHTTPTLAVVGSFCLLWYQASC